MNMRRLNTGILVPIDTAFATSVTSCVDDIVSELKQEKYLRIPVLERRDNPLAEELNRSTEANRGPMVDRG
jgi:CBS domain containing-hemolysin-like protein